MLSLPFFFKLHDTSINTDEAREIKMGRIGSENLPYTVCIIWNNLI